MSIAVRLAKTAAITSIAFIYGCAGINKVPDNVEAESKQFKSDPVSSQVYLYRNETLGAALSMPVTVDGKPAGSTGAHTFFMFKLPAGSHTFTSQGNESTLAVTTEAGKNYFIWQEVKMGVFSGGSRLQLVSEAEGKKGVSECSQIQSDF